jgi:hypothetical protein
MEHINHEDHTDRDNVSTTSPRAQPLADSLDVQLI